LDANPRLPPEWKLVEGIQNSTVGAESTNMPRLRRSLRAMKPKAEVIVPAYKQVVEI
jgi:hypothetical protein